MRLGAIGFGSRMSGVWDLIDHHRAGAELVAITDVKNQEISERITAAGGDASAIAFYEDPDEMLDQQKLDGVMIGTRCSLHTRLAVKVLERNLPLFLEKPVATNMQDLMTLRDAAARSTSEVVVSFPLRSTTLVTLAKEIIDSGKIGTVEHVQAWNNVPYGWIYYQAWYRNENETQGLFLQKATHDLDYINYLLGAKPKTVCAMISKQIFKGDHPAGLKCDDCDEQQTCPESPFHLYYSRGETDRVQPSGRLCAFATDSGNEDSGSAIIRYESGMHACYSQNFFARRGAAKRGATLIGYKGTIEFDFYTNTLTVHMHHTPRVETHKFDDAAHSHFGGDTALADSFIRVVRGEAKSIAPLSAGLQSALLCLKAKESAATDTFQAVEYPDERSS